jgi:hypothetical protein
MPAYPAEANLLRVAKAWRMSPSQFRTQSADDQALMVALEMFEGTRDAYREQWRQERQDRGPKKQPLNEFEEMKRRMKLK